MKALRIIQISILFALGVALLAFISPAAACESISEDDLRCASVRLRPPPPLPPRVAVAVASTKPIVIANEPRGGSPNDAMEAKDAWQKLDAGAYAWYKIDNGNNFYLNLWLDAYGKSGVNLATFAPEQANGLSVASPPKGRGAPIKSDPSHDMFWSGSQARGIWYALVTNTNPFPVDYKVGYKQATEDRNCTSYWEWIKADYVYWTACR